jgi:hypothetical protein
MAQMTPAEHLVSRKLLEYLEEDYSLDDAAQRTAFELGVNRSRVIRLWIEQRLEERLTR